MASQEANLQLVAFVIYFRTKLLCKKTIILCREYGTFLLAILRSHWVEICARKLATGELGEEAVSGTEARIYGPFY